MKDTCDTTPLIGYDDALAQLTEGIETRTEVIELGLRDALGRVLARDIDSAIDVPGCALSAMDGYAVASRDIGDGQVTRGDCRHGVHEGHGHLHDRAHAFDEEHDRVVGSDNRLDKRSGR